MLLGSLDFSWFSGFRILGSFVGLGLLDFGLLDLDYSLVFKGFGSWFFGFGLFRFFLLDLDRFGFSGSGSSWFFRIWVSFVADTKV